MEPVEAKALLIKRGNHPWKGHWDHPRKLRGPGENFTQASSRELEEKTEMKLPPEAMEYVGLMDEPKRDPWMRVHVVCLPEILKSGAAAGAADAQLVSIEEIFAKEPLVAGDHRQSIRASLMKVLESCPGA